MDRRQGRRVLAIGLDGYEQSVGDALMAAGELPALARLRGRSARFLLDHGAAQRTGLAWEHVSTGRSPDDAERWSAVDFDRRTYRIWQRGTSLTPFTAGLAAPTVVFDPPYFDLDRAPATRGVVNWGAHDPGVPVGARPDDLHAELNARFGPYPAKKWIYGLPWPSAERARTMGEALTRATDLRAEAATWVLRERLPDWQLGLVVTGELHSAIEGLWHGFDPAHPLHHLPSAKPAGEGLHGVYRAVDRLVGRLTETFSDATVVTFAMGGMGPNRSDVDSMVLLPELLYRHAFGRPLLTPRPEWVSAEGGLPMLAENEDWSNAVIAQILRPHTTTTSRVARRARRWGHRLASIVRHAPTTSPRTPELSLGWMPASRYQPHWRAMRFFALPSFYDGRIRINLVGRERHGLVPAPRYEDACAEAEALVRACRDTITGEPVVEAVERTGGRNPLGLDPSAADLVFIWRGTAVGFDHPALGRIGPVPLRRSGGHTGPFGMAYVSGDGIAPGDYGTRSSFDVVPTLVGLLGAPRPSGLSGTPLLAV